VDQVDLLKRRSSVILSREDAQLRATRQSVVVSPVRHGALEGFVPTWNIDMERVKKTRVKRGNRAERTEGDRAEILPESPVHLAVQPHMGAFPFGEPKPWCSGYQSF
jgi:hypothetical protein